MDYEDVQEGYDSDHIDPELEYRLYDAIFFDTTSSVNHYHDEANKREESHAHSTSVANMVPGTMEKVPICDSSNISASRMDSTYSRTTTGSFVRVSTFRDYLSSDSDSTLQHIISDNKSVYNAVHLDTAVSFPEPDMDSVSCSSRSQTDDECITDDIVLGVAHDSQSSICNLDDAIAIAKRLSNSANDANLWRISDADRIPSRSSKNRYFRSSEDSICYTCRKRGHYASECNSSGPTCILCGKEGHSRDQCEELYCYACLAPGHLKNRCPLLGELRKSVCQRCGQQGHCSSICTELWRQYRHTTKNGKPVELKRTVRHRGCCNCGRRGHCVDDCFRKPFRSNFLGPLPKRRVLVYDKRDIYKSARIRPTKDRKGAKKLSKKLKISKPTQKKEQMKKCPNQLQSDVKEQELSFNSIEQSVNGVLLNKVIEQELGFGCTDLVPEKAELSNHTPNSKTKRSKRKGSNSRKEPRKGKSKAMKLDSSLQQAVQQKPSDPSHSHYYLSDDESYRLYDVHQNECEQTSMGKTSRQTNKIRRTNTCPSLMCTNPWPLNKETTLKIGPITTATATTSNSNRRIQPTNKRKNHKKFKNKVKNETESNPLEIGPTLSGSVIKKQKFSNNFCRLDNSSTPTVSVSTETANEECIYQSNPGWLKFLAADSAIESWDSGLLNEIPNSKRKTKTKCKLRKFSGAWSKKSGSRNRNTTSQQP